MGHKESKLPSKTKAEGAEREKEEDNARKISQELRERCERFLHFSSVDLSNAEQAKLPKLQEKIYVILETRRRRFYRPKETRALLWEALEHPMLTTRLACDVVRCEGALTFLVPRKEDGELIVLPHLEDDGNSGGVHEFVELDMMMRKLRSLSRAERDELSKSFAEFCCARWMFPYSDTKDALLQLTGLCVFFFVLFSIMTLRPFPPLRTPLRGLLWTFSSLF